MSEQLDDLVIRFPARGGYLGISRLNTTAMAATVGFDVEQLDDLRLAVDEAVSWLVADENRDGIVELTINCDRGRLELHGRRSEPGLAERAPDDLIHAILGATVDSYETGVDSDGRRFIALSKKTTIDG